MIKRCERGHALHMSWRSCPRCSGASPEDARGDRGDLSGTVLVSPVSSDPRSESLVPTDCLLRLVVERDGAEPQQVDFEAGRWKLGRIPRAQEGYRLVAFESDPSMSRDHAILEVGPAAILVRDLKSMNGTFVNGQRIERHVLIDGDILQLGETRLRALVRGPSSSV